MAARQQPSFVQVRDRVLGQINQMLRTLADSVEGSGRKSPANLAMQQQTDATLSLQDKCHIAALMRVNHTGEVMAQALYYGQMIWVDEGDPLHTHLSVAALEEEDHLRWCKQRIEQLGSKPSVLNPICYLGAFGLGAVAGACGREYSLGFVAEVEQQVHIHLQSHLDQLPSEDTATREVIEQMQQDEDRHRQNALASGGKPLPQIASMGLKAVSRIMTSVAYRM